MLWSGHDNVGDRGTHQVSRAPFCLMDLPLLGQPGL